MEIITPRTDEQQQVTCPHCGAVIGYYDTEVKSEYLPAVTGRFRTIPPRFLFNYINCPSCELQIRLKD